MACYDETPLGYNYDFIDEIPDDFICDICRLVMRKPVQTKCGHRFCKYCLEAATRSRKICPVDRGRLQTHEIFDDKATERKILSFKVKCPDCIWRGELRNIQVHTDSCLMAIVPCSYEVFGCDFKGPRKSLKEHIKNGEGEHLAITTEQLLSLHQENASLKKQVVTNSTMEKSTKNPLHFHYIWKVDHFSIRLQEAKQQSYDFVLFSEPFYTQKFGYKLKLLLRPNGYDEFKGSYMSVGIIVMRGEYDILLQWPFERKFMVFLLDHGPQGRQLEKCPQADLTPDGDDDLEYFERPITDENPGFGMPDFVSHEELATGDYIVDDSIFLLLKVRT